MSYYNFNIAYFIADFYVGIDGSVYLLRYNKINVQYGGSVLEERQPNAYTFIRDDIFIHEDRDKFMALQRSRGFEYGIEYDVIFAMAPEFRIQHFLPYYN